MRHPSPASLVAVLCLAAALGTSVATPAHANGLVVSRPEGGPVPPPDPHGPPVTLAAHRVTATLAERVAHVEVEQVFRNRTDATLEGTYLFPLPEGASVSGFAMTMGGEMVEGEIVAADKARAIYERIVRHRRDPGLLEYVGRGVFRARVFPIGPRADVTIRMTFQQIVPEDGGLAELRYPLATDRLHEGAVGSVTIDVTVESRADIRALYSPSHRVEVVRDGPRKARVTYESAGARQRRDFLLYVGRGAEAIAFSSLAHKPAGARGTFLAIFAPPVTVPEAQRAPKDVVYVLDTSGSMGEDGKLDQARRALEHGIGVLGPEDRFAIVTFASSVRRFRDALMPASAEMRTAARGWLGGIEAHGGTDVAEGLDAALGLGREDRLTLVVLLSDGKPTVGLRTADAILARVAERNAADARVFTFGVGYDVDVRLLDRIAETTRGARDYVAPREELEVVTSRFFRKVNHPVMTDVTIDFGDGVTDVYPREVADFFAGSQILVMGRYATPGPRTIRLEGTVAGSEAVYEYAVDWSTEAKRPALPRLWAHRKVAFLLDDLRLHGESKEVVDEIVRLATRYAIVTPYTSGLVVEEDELEGRMSSESTIWPLGGHRRAERPTPSSPSGGHGGAYRGPGGAVGRREPTDPTPPPTPPPPTSPAPTSPAPTSPAPTSPAPSTPAGTKVEESERLKELKERRDGAAGDLEHDRVRSAADKTFVLEDGVWTDRLYDPRVHEAAVEVEVFSDAWLALLRKDDKIAKYLALGSAVRFVWKDTAYLVKPTD